MHAGQADGERYGFQSMVRIQETAKMKAIQTKLRNRKFGKMVLGLWKDSETLNKYYS